MRLSILATPRVAVRATARRRKQIASLHELARIVPVQGSMPRRCARAI